jgi:hypothetical protein
MADVGSWFLGREQGRLKSPMPLVMNAVGTELWNAEPPILERAATLAGLLRPRWSRCVRPSTRKPSRFRTPSLGDTSQRSGGHTEAG